MTIQQCKYVLAILKRGSFNEAAKTLFIAQSSLSASVKALENELNIKIFERSNSGVLLTDEGAEFVRYASCIAEQNDFVTRRYTDGNKFKNLHIATQHYDFVADIFTKMINSIAENAYKISLKETQTYDVIKEVEKGYCDIGIIAIKNTDYDIMKRFLGNKKLEFTPILKAKPHVFVRKGHLLSREGCVTYSRLKEFPFVSYEQGKHANSFFTEKITAQEFLKMLVCLLGYKEVSEKKAPGYTGYIMQASQMGMTNSVPLITDKPLTRGQAAKLISNSLDIPVMVQTSFGKNNEYMIMNGKDGREFRTVRMELENR